MSHRPADSTFLSGISAQSNSQHDMITVSSSEPSTNRLSSPASPLSTTSTDLPVLPVQEPAIEPSIAVGTSAVEGELLLNSAQGASASATTASSTQVVTIWQASAELLFARSSFYVLKDIQSSEDDILAAKKSIRKSWKNLSQAFVVFATLSSAIRSLRPITTTTTTEVVMNYAIWASYVLCLLGYTYCQALCSALSKKRNVNVSATTLKGLSIVPLALLLLSALLFIIYLFYSPSPPTRSVTDKDWCRFLVQPGV